MTTHTSSRWLPASIAAALLAGTLTVVAVNVGDAASNAPFSLWVSPAPAQPRTEQRRSA